MTEKRCLEANAHAADETRPGSEQRHPGDCHDVLCVPSQWMCHIHDECFQPVCVCVQMPGQLFKLLRGGGMA